MDKKTTKIKKEKSEEYKFKKGNWMKIFRVLLWICLIWIFIRGVLTTFRPDQTEEVTQLINQFRADFANYKDQDAEIMGFAQNFAREYLTYKNEDEYDYKKRLEEYVSRDFINIPSILDFKGNAEAIYVEAYRKEEYSPTQYDVYVKASVKYTLQTLAEDGTTYNTSADKQDFTLKVPVYISNGAYIIEDLPLFVNDDVKYAEYTSVPYPALEISDSDIRAGIQKSLESFLKAYYEQDQNVINYYLTKDADPDKFIGLNGRMKFDSIDDLRCYMDEGSADITCIIKIKVKDGVNGVTVYQQFNVVVIQSNDKYYISDMETKTVNLSIKQTTEVKK